MGGLSDASASKRDPSSNDRPAGESLYNIVGERVALGPLQRELLPTYLRWINNFATRRMLRGYSTPMTMEEESAWYERASTSDRDVAFTIYEQATGQPIGVTGLHGIDRRDREAEFGIFIGEAESRGKGYGTETACLMLDYAFIALDLHNVMLKVAECNPAARRAYARAGFREFGRRRESFFMGGKMWDTIYMECLATEFNGSVLKDVFAPDPPREAEI